MEFQRPIYWNKTAESWRTLTLPEDLIYDFHRKLPNYSPTKLVSLDQVANEIGVKAVYLKNESQRLGLPSFKILGASWGTFRALAQKFHLPLDSDLETVERALSKSPYTLFAATDGNHGRAVAHMGSILGMQVEIFVPKGMHHTTAHLIEKEGAKVTEVIGSYDLAVQVAFDMAEKSNGVLVQDTAFERYEEIPSVS
jgi:diaminopropionate ammonia-lyase family